MKKSSGFNLLSVIIIIIVTAIVTSIATGVIIFNNPTTTLGNTSYNIDNDEELKDFIEVYKTLLLRYYDNIDKKGMLNAAEEAMLKFLGDKYTTYLNDEEYKEIIDELSGEYNRIGLVVEGNFITRVLPLSAAFKAGIKKDDYIIKVNDINVEKMNSTEIGEIIKNSNKSLTITILRNNNYIDLILEKDIYPSLSYQIIDNTNIGYIYIKNFSQNLKEQVSNALKDLELSGMTSLIIDVRDNIGGYLSAAEETSALFLEKGKVIYSLESNNSKYTYNDETNEKRTYQIIVLINQGTASAAEILAAALKDSYPAVLVGTKSYGKGKVQQVVSLNNGDSVKYTSAKWITPSGICIDGIGLIPDYSVAYEEDGMYDSQLSKAIELLQ